MTLNFQAMYFLDLKLKEQEFPKDFCPSLPYFSIYTLRKFSITYVYNIIRRNISKDNLNLYF